MAKTRTLPNNNHGWILEIVNDNGTGHWIQVHPPCAHAHALRVYSVHPCAR